MWHSRLWNTWLGKTFAVLMLLLGCLPAAHAAFTIARTSSPTFYIDTGVSPQLTGMYASYQITSSTAVADVWVGIGGFTGAFVGPAANEDGDVHLGSFTAGQTKTAFFYLNASGATLVTQSHTVTVYDARPPFANALASAGFSFVGDSLGGPVQETIKAASNTVTTVVSGPNPPGLGGLVTITVSGKTGVIGAALRLAFTAAAFPNWPANKLEMIGSSITLSGGNSGTFTDTLLITATSSTDTNYVATYIFRATGTTTAPTTISPVAYISSGTQIKHTDTSSYTSLAAIQPISNFVTLTKLVSAATLPQQGGTVTYTLRFTNSGSVDVALDSVVDTLPISPAAATTWPARHASMAWRSPTP